MLTAKEAAAELGIPVSIIKREIAAGRLAVTDGRITRTHLDQYIALCRVERMPAPERRRLIQSARLCPNPAHDALLDAAHANRTRFPYSGPAVYFLYRGDELVYVGMAVNLLRRVASHFGRKDFDCFSWIECPHEQLRDLERRAIIRFKPRLNKL